MNDLISRQAAIDAIDRERKNKHLFNMAEDGLLEARGVINTLPSAEPETDDYCDTCKEYDLVKHSCPRFNRVIRTALESITVQKKGKWIKHETGVTLYECSHCGVWFLADHLTRNSFCPNCGTDMRGE